MHLLGPGPAHTGLLAAAPALNITALLFGYLEAKQKAAVPPRECPENIIGKSSVIAS